MVSRSLARIALTALVALALGSRSLAVTLAMPEQQDCPVALADRLAKQVTPWLDTINLSGVILVACKGTPIYSVAKGQANRSTGEANALQTRFNLGSMNKMWTAIAVAQLVEQGKVDVDAPVGRYLPDLTNQTIRDKVLVRHLLTHTSGLGSYFSRGFLRDRIYANRANDYLPFFIDDAPAFTPGERMQYSNAGFALLSVIVEKVSALSYFEYMRRNILARAGMAPSAFDDARTPRPGTAIPYGTPPGAPELIDTSNQIEARGGPAGGAFASAADVVAFSRAVWAGRLVGLPVVKQFTAGQVAMGPGIRYAFGFGDGTLNGWRHVGHNGGAPGVGTEFMSFPEHDIDIVVLTNMDMPVATQVMGRVARVVTGQDLPVVATPAEGAASFVAAPIGKDGWPESVQGRRVRGFFAALAQGGADYTAFIEQQMVPQPGRSAAERAAGVADIRERFGAFTLENALTQSANSIQVMMKSEKQGRVRFIFDFEPAPSLRIAMVDMKPGTAGVE